MRSQKFYDFIELYKIAHRDGVHRKLWGGEEYDIPGKDTFRGSELMEMRRKLLICNDLFKFNSIYDFGCGKADAYNKRFQDPKTKNWFNGLSDYLNVPKENIHLYDPGVPKYEVDADKSKKFDLVIATDVLEHIPSEDCEDVVDELFARANSLVFISVACYLAGTILADGNNAHCNIKHPKYWEHLFLEKSRKYDRYFYAKIITEEGAVNLANVPRILTETIFM